MSQDYEDQQDERQRKNIKRAILEAAKEEANAQLRDQLIKLAIAGLVVCLCLACCVGAYLSYPGSANYSNRLPDTFATPR